jgi:lipoprotein NlpI
MALKLKPNHPGEFINLANCKLRINDFKGAFIDFDRAISISPNNAVAYHNRGIAKIFNGERISGRADLLKSQALGYPAPDEYFMRFCL